MPNTNAVVVRAGAQSLHPQWLKPAKPEFDLFVVSYEPIPPFSGHVNVFEVLIPGRKVAGWREFFHTQPNLLDRYEYIALMDNDLECTSEVINTLFRIGREKKLALWQPSFTWDSYFTYGVFLRNPILNAICQLHRNDVPLLFV